MPVLLVAAAQGALASGQDDAGLGFDAPDRWEDAVDVAAASHRATLHPLHGDLADWYRVQAVDRELLVIAVRFDDAAPDARIRLLLDDGTLWREMSATGTAYFPDGQPMRVGVLLPDPAPGTEPGDAVVSYTLSVQALDQPDLQVRMVAVGVEEGFAQTNRVRLEVSNLGNGAALNASLRVAATTDSSVPHPLSCYWSLLRATIDLAPGSVQHYNVAWSVLGAFGDAKVSALVSHPLDWNHDNDHDEIDAYANVGGTGVGGAAFCPLT